MKKGIDKLIKKIRNINWKKIKKDIIFYLKTNKLTLTFIITSLINGIILRFLTVKNYFNLKPVIGDLLLILVIVSFCYLFKPKNQFKYYLPWTFILSILCIINCIYYSNYISFASISLLKTSTELGGYTDAVTNLFELKYFIFLLQIPILIIVHNYLKKKNYYNKVKDIEIGKVRIFITFCLIIFFGLIFSCTLSKKDISRLNKQWDRRYTVMEFGIYTYQANDILSSIRISLANIFTDNEAYDEFKEYFNNDEKVNNKYTNLFENKNVIVIHAESIQGFLMNLKFNGNEVTPNINKLADEGIYFSNFYTEESIGNSSDSEFTFLTSLLPVSSGTVFVNYYDREFPSILKLLKEKDYYTFSMHGNVASAWNRNNTYKSLGYDKFYAYKDAFEIDETLGLGLSDKSFFRQSVDIIKEIKNNNKHFYGTMVMLTNHTPFESLVDTEYYDDYNVNLIDENGNEIEYLEGSKMGNYIKSANYADAAIGQFINDLEANGLLDDTVIVLYGDHDSKLKKSEFEKLYYSEYINDVSIDANKILTVIDDYTYEINRKVPFIIWSKDIVDSEYNVEIDNVMGMVDVMPTLGNMLGVNNKFALGHDMFDNQNNMVVFPDGSFITNDLYYDNSKDEYKQLNTDTTIDIDQLNKYKKYSSKLLNLSNNIIVYDFIKKYNNENFYN